MRNIEFAESQISPSGNVETLAQVGRRQLLKSGLALGVVGAPLTQWLSGCATLRPRAAATFERIAASAEDALRIPPGYRAQVLLRWGDSIGCSHLSAGAPAFNDDASNTAAEQECQAGMHHDGMHFFPLGSHTSQSPRGLLAINHEYTDDGLLHVGGIGDWSHAKVAKSQAAHGVSVVEVAIIGGEWRLVRPSIFARRITANTAMRIGGPVAGSDWVKTAADAKGDAVLGTFANCAHGFTPWGTYLTCEENWHGYFHQTNAASTHEKRYGIAARPRGYRWWEFDARFDTAKNPNEPNRFGWVVEIDPFDPQSMPVKRTAMGRMKHESAMQSIAPDGRVVFYMGDDEAFEYIYKFVSRDAWNPRDRAANRHLLDHGTLYVARFDSNGGGVWLPLVHNEGPLTAANGFSNQADVLVMTRQAADLLGATKMDRPEWIAVHPESKEVYCNLTNNTQRGKPGRPATDAANPRADNAFGHIIRWREAGGDPASREFVWDIFVLAGHGNHNAEAANDHKRGNINGDLFASPDGLWFDTQARLWIATDVSPGSMNKGDYAHIGNNQLLVADVVTGEIKRFLTGPVGCEIASVVSTPDGRHLFVNIQHPGETPGERSDPNNPMRFSNWPDGPRGGRPRSATIVIRKIDGGVIGT